MTDTRRHRPKPPTTPENATKTREDAALGYSPTTALGHLALAVRRDFFARGGHAVTRDDISRDVADRRGGARTADAE